MSFRQQVASALRWHWQTLRLCRTDEELCIALGDMLDDLSFLLVAHIAKRQVGREVQAELERIQQDDSHPLWRWKSLPDDFRAELDGVRDEEPKPVGIDTQHIQRR